jgi:hypothetical protein
MSYASSTGLYDIIEKFANYLASQSGVQMYDFGDSRTAMPIPDPKSGSYLVSSMCFLWKPATASSTAEEFDTPPAVDGLIARVNGRLFIGVEFWTGTTPGDLMKKLEAAKEKLLAA